MIIGKKCMQKKRWTKGGNDGAKKKCTIYVNIEWVQLDKKKGPRIKIDVLGNRIRRIGGQD